MQIEKFQEFIDNCNDFKVKIIGKSVLGQKIYAINKVYNPSFEWVILTAGMHAREHLSCDFLCCQLEKLKSLPPLNYNISAIPLVNPDGVRLVTQGAGWLDEQRRERLIRINGSEDFSLFKANANGVDLNNNWDAGWDKHFSDKAEPSSQGFYGYNPMSEPETRALAKWTARISPFMTISYHLKGEEVYFDYFQSGMRRKRDKKIANIFARETGYRIRSTQSRSSGGYKDYCVQNLKIPALTIELGDDKYPHPFPEKELKYILLKHQNLFECIEKSLKIYQNYQKNFILY